MRDARLAAAVLAFLMIVFLWAPITTGGYYAAVDILQPLAERTHDGLYFRLFGSLTAACAAARR
jgi:hypothetical protein